jgi:hypothetical protein
LGSGVRQDQRLCAVADLDLPQRPRVGQTPTRQAGRRLRGAGQRVPVMRGPQGPAARLRSARFGSGAQLLLAVAAAAALAVHPVRSSSRLRVRAGVPSVRGVRHPRLRPTPSRSGVLRRTDPRPPRHRPPRPGRGHLRPSGQLPHTRIVSHQGHHQRCRPPGELLLPLLPAQAVLQGAPRSAHRASDLRHPRLRDRPACHCRELEGPQGRWRSRQPSPLRRTGIRRRARS